MDGNTIGQASNKILKSMSKAVTYVWVQKQSNISPMVICSPCLYQLIDRKTF